MSSGSEERVMVVDIIHMIGHEFFEESNFANTDLVERWGEGGIMRSRRRKGVCKDGVCKGVVRFFQSGKAVGIRERGLEEWPIGSEGLVRDRNGSGVVGGIGWVKIL